MTAPMCTAPLHRGRALALLVVLGWLSLTAPRRAAAEPAPGPDRVVLADPDPELVRAVTGALAPWRFELIVAPTAPINEADAAARARATGARFVVWRREDHLFVFDRDRRALEERASTAGPLDEIGAASVALTVKTLMRLPPPRPVVDPAPSSAGGIALRAQATLASQLARGSDTEFSGRLIAAVLARPSSRMGWRFGAAGEIGTAPETQRAGFKGTWSDWKVLALVSWTYPRPPWEIEPTLGGGISRSTLEGTEMNAERLERATLGVIRAGGAFRRRVGRWTIGATANLDIVLSTPTYTKSGSSVQVYQVPSVAFALGLVAAADFLGSGR